jgi:hypothetical protein
MAALDPNQIVEVDVFTILAPFPNDYQQTGALLSYGGTNQPTGSINLLTQFSDLELIISDPMAIATADWATGLVTVETVDPIPVSIGGMGATAKLQLSGFDPPGYNGTFICTVTGPSEFTYPLVDDPGATTPASQPQLQLYAAAELNAMAATFFRQGGSATVSVLELGYGSLFSDQVVKLTNWLTENDRSFYGYVLPEEWGYDSNLRDPVIGGQITSIFEQFSAPSGPGASMTYFWLTIEEAAIGLISKAWKSVIQLIEAPSVRFERDNAFPGEFAEFTIAGMFYWAMQFRATSVTRVAPMCFKYVYGVTPYPIKNNGPLLISFKENFVNYIQTGAEGGINYTDVYQGVTSDGFDYFNWWWTIDWVQIQINLDLSNAIINGSNNPLAPLYYDQPGINFLQTTLVGTMQSGVTFGMVNGNIVATQYTSPQNAQAIQLGTYAGMCNVNAVPFMAYSEAEPTHYGIGEYDGLSVLFIPARGFVHIKVTVIATDLVTI